MITDINGKILTNILTETRVDRSGGILSETRAMAVSPDHKAIYLVTGNIPHTCGGDKCVALSFDGQIIFTYQDKTRTTIKGVCCDSEGHVFLINKVIMLNNKGERLKDIIDVLLQSEINNIPNEFIEYIAFGQLNWRLYVGWERWCVESWVLICNIRY